MPLLAANVPLSSYFHAMARLKGCMLVYYFLCTIVFVFAGFSLLHKKNSKPHKSFPHRASKVMLSVIPSSAF